MGNQISNNGDEKNLMNKVNELKDIDLDNKKVRGTARMSNGKVEAQILYDSDSLKDNESSYKGVLTGSDLKSSDSFPQNKDIDQNVIMKDYILINSNKYKDIDSTKAASEISFTNDKNEIRKLNEMIPSDKIHLNLNSDAREVKLSTTFEWKEGGNNVYMTGNFCNWNQKFMMTRLNNNFELTLVYIFICY